MAQYTAQPRNQFSISCRRALLLTSLLAVPLMTQPSHAGRVVGNSSYFCRDLLNLGGEAEDVLVSAEVENIKSRWQSMNDELVELIKAAKATVSAVPKPQIADRTQEFQEALEGISRKMAVNQFHLGRLDDRIKRFTVEREASNGQILELVLTDEQEKILAELRTEVEQFEQQRKDLKTEEGVIISNKKTWESQTQQAREHYVKAVHEVEAATLRHIYSILNDNMQSFLDHKGLSMREKINTMVSLLFAADSRQLPGAYFNQSGFVLNPLVLKYIREHDSNMNRNIDSGFSVFISQALSVWLDDMNWDPKSDRKDRLLAWKGLHLAVVMSREAKTKDFLRYWMQKRIAISKEGFSEAGETLIQKFEQLLKDAPRGSERIHNAISNIDETLYFVENVD